MSTAAMLNPPANLVSDASVSQKSARSSTAVGRPVPQSKAFKTTLANKDVVSMFNDSLNPSSDGSKLPIVHKKYDDVKGLANRFLKALSFIRDMAAVGANFPGPRNFLAEYVVALTRQFQESFTAPEIGSYIPAATLEATDYSKVPPELATLYVKTYSEVKKCNIVNIMIVVCKNLSAHKGSLVDVNNLQDQFLKGAGSIFSPFPSLPQLNIKQIYSTIGEKDKQMLLAILSRLYTITHEVHEIVISPDADMGELVHIVLSSIDEVKKQIPRCEQAFEKIAESVEMLKGNFNTYYSDYVSSGNSSIILENFVLDVSKASKTSTAVTAQFRRIITHYRKMSSNNNDPKLKALFGQAEANFREANDTKSEPPSITDESADIVSDIPAEATEATPDGSAVAPIADSEEGKAARNRRKKAKSRAKAKEKALAVVSSTEPVGIDDLFHACEFGIHLDEERESGQHSATTADTDIGLADELDLEQRLKSKLADVFLGEDSLPEDSEQCLKTKLVRKILGTGAPAESHEVGISVVNEESGPQEAEEQDFETPREDEGDAVVLVHT